MFFKILGILAALARSAAHPQLRVLRGLKHGAVLNVIEMLLNQTKFKHYTWSFVKSVELQEMRPASRRVCHAP